MNKNIYTHTYIIRIRKKDWKGERIKVSTVTLLGTAFVKAYENGLFLFDSPGFVCGIVRSSPTEFQNVNKFPRECF